MVEGKSRTKIVFMFGVIYFGHHYAFYYEVDIMFVFILFNYIILRIKTIVNAIEHAMD